MKRAFALAVVWLGLMGGIAHAQSPDDQYVGIFGVIQQADSLLQSGDVRLAVTRYREAHAALDRLQTVHPNWNPKIVKFRLDYVATKLSEASAKLPPALVPEAPATTRPATATRPAEPSPELLAELRALREQVGQLEADRGLLEAKLKEALATQPAALDPRELAKADERIRALEKETDLLKVTLEQERTKKPATGDTATLDRLRQELADANRNLAGQAERLQSLSAEKANIQQQLDAKSAADATELAKARERVQALESETSSLKASLEQERARKPAPDTAAMDQLKAELAQANRQVAEQSDLAKSLAQEKAEIQKRLGALAAAPTENAELTQTRQALAEANRRLTEQTEAGQKLAQEKQALQARVQALSADAEALAALRAENELLRKQAAASKPATSDRDAERELQQARAQIAALQSDMELLRAEKAALENRADAAMATAALATSAVTAGGSERIQALEKEREELQKKLDSALRELVRSQGTTLGVEAQETARQLAALRSRIEILEARPIPYSAEELALMTRPAPRLAATATTTTAAPRSNAPVPSASPGTLVAEAQRQFASRQYDQAEEKFVQALRQDDRNATSHANLAVIQMELNKLEDAEAHARQAVAAAPGDAFGHSVLGQVKLRQNHYDEAFDALSRAAELNPKSAEIQNFLGITLSHKGLRVPAETALRKAIQLEPGYASAHNNLAVIYLNQKPPMVELARWHYKKALAAGQPKNAELEKALEAASPAH